MEKEKNILFTLPRSYIFGAEIVMLFMWITMAFWAIVFLSSGFLQIGNVFLIDKVYGGVMMFIGFLLFVQIVKNVNRTRDEGLRVIVTDFLNNRFPELIATTVFLLATAVIVGNNIHFIVTDFLTLPFIAGSTFSLMFGYFISDTLHIPFAPSIVLLSMWFLQIIWIFFFAKLIVKIITSFRLRSNID